MSTGGRAKRTLNSLLWLMLIDSLVNGMDYSTTVSKNLRHFAVIYFQKQWVL